MARTLHLTEEQYLGMLLVMQHAFHEVFQLCDPSHQGLLSQVNDAAIVLIEGRHNKEPVNNAAHKRLAALLEGGRTGEIDPVRKLWFNIFTQTPSLGMNDGDEEKLQLLDDMGNPDYHYQIDQKLAEFKTIFSVEVSRRR